MLPIAGRCLCGGITMTVHEIAGALMFCHCRACRKSVGAPFVAALPVPTGAFFLHDPAQHMAAFRMTPHMARYFCSTCGSALYSQRDGADTVRVRAGVLDLPATVPLGGHIYCADAAGWDVIHDTLPRYAGIEPGRTPIITQEGNVP